MIVRVQMVHLGSIMRVRMMRLVAVVKVWIDIRVSTMMKIASIMIARI